MNSTHIAIETWVDGQVFAEGDPSVMHRGRTARTVFDSFKPYLEEEIQQLMISAYDAVYAKNACMRKYDRLTKKKIEAGAWGSMAILGGGRLSSVKPTVGDIIPIDIDLSRFIPYADWQILRTTWPHYLDRSKKYAEKAFVDPTPLQNFNMDQGVCSFWACRSFSG